MCCESLPSSSNGLRPVARVLSAFGISFENVSNHSIPRSKYALPCPSSHHFLLSVLGGGSTQKLITSNLLLTLRLHSNESEEISKSVSTRESDNFDEDTLDDFAFRLGNPGGARTSIELRLWYNSFCNLAFASWSKVRIYITLLVYGK